MHIKIKAIHNVEMPIGDAWEIVKTVTDPRVIQQLIGQYETFEPTASRSGIRFSAWRPAPSPVGSGD